MIYLIILIALGGLAILDYKYKYKYSDIIFYLTMTFMLLFIGLRYQVGHDWDMYFQIHKIDTWHLTNGDFIEPTFTLISKFTKLLSNNDIVSFQILIFIYALISIIAYGYIIKKYSSNRMLSIFILFPMYMLNTNFGQIRYGIALALFIISIEFIINRDLKKYLMVVLIATLFHFTAIVAIPLYFLINLNISYKYKISILAGAIILGTLINPLDLIKIINDNTLNLVYINDKIAIYKQNEGDLFSMYFIMMLALYLFSSYIYNKINIKNDLIKVSIEMLFWGIIFYCITNRLDILAFRGSSYYFIFEILLIPALMSILNKQKYLFKYRNVLVVYTVIVAFYRLIITVFYWLDVFAPYRSIL